MTAPSTPAEEAKKKAEEEAKLRAAASPSLTNQRVGDIIKTWQTKLREHVKAFADEARMVSDWDADVRECNQKLRTLAEDVNKLKKSQDDLNGHLRDIGNHQSAMETKLKSLEEHVTKMQEQDGSGDMHPADRARQESYRVAQSVDNQLTQMQDSLADLVHLLNQEFDERQDDPVEQVRDILDSHMTSMQKIESDADRLAAQVEEVCERLKHAAPANAGGSRFQAQSHHRR